ncbi:MAG: cysteine-rich KTR domain-containing protein [Ruthenibacterium sp.]
MGETQWIMCPVCGSKIRLRIRCDTVLERFPLYCPKCKRFYYFILWEAKNQI